MDYTPRFNQGTQDPSKVPPVCPIHPQIHLFAVYPMLMDSSYDSSKTARKEKIGKNKPMMIQLIKSCSFSQQSSTVINLYQLSNHFTLAFRVKPCFSRGFFPICPVLAIEAKSHGQQRVHLNMAPMSPMPPVSSHRFMIIS